MAIPKPRRQHDMLLKGAFEEWFADFLRFMYPNADAIFDFSRKFIFMDKELYAILRLRDRRKGARVADLLVKVYMKNGGEKFFLIHTEIEGSSDPHFPFRLIQSHYRIFDKEKTPVETIVVYTGDKSQPRPNEYRYDGIGTSLHFKYLSYHILDHTEEELLAMNNPFALVILACQKALLEGKVPDEELGEGRLTIAKALLRHRYPHDKVLSFMNFLKNILYIDNQEINRKFDIAIKDLTENKIVMGGIMEAIKQIAKEEAREEVWEEVRKEAFEEARKEVRKEAFEEARKEVWEEAFEEARKEVWEEAFEEARKEVWEEAFEEARKEVWGEAWKEAKAQGIEKSVRNLIKASLLTDEQIASALEVTMEYVAGIRQKLEGVGSE